MKKIAGIFSLFTLFPTLGARGNSRARDRVSYISSILFREIGLRFSSPLIDQPPTDIGRPSGS